MWQSTYLSIYGMLFTVFSFIFWARAHSYEYPGRSLLRLFYSVSAGWLLTLGTIRLFYTDWDTGPRLVFPVNFGLFSWLFILLEPLALWVMPILLFTGFQMHLYGLFPSKK